MTNQKLVVKKLNENSIKMRVNGVPSKEFSELVGKTKQLIKQLEEIAEKENK